MEFLWVVFFIFFLLDAVDAFVEEAGVRAFVGSVQDGSLAQVCFGCLKSWRDRLGPPVLGNILLVYVKLS